MLKIKNPATPVSQLRFLLEQAYDRRDQAELLALSQQIDAWQCRLWAAGEGAAKFDELKGA
ncbi:MAG: hypothetical protein IJ662_11380 [Clostridia bacterium]|nr:hypothetical protein [Clostridia bacterium]